MYCFALLTVLSCALLVQADDASEWMEFMETCGRVMHPGGLLCCNKKYVSADFIEEIKECMQLPGRGASCEREICVAKKKGFASDDGTLDKPKLKSALSNLDDKDLQKTVIEDCLDGDVSDYGPEDFCELKKVNTCIRMHLVADCPGWSNEGPCSGSAEAAAACLKGLS